MVKENCGVVGIFSLSGTNVIPMVIDALRALQHRGQEAWGLAIPNKPPLKRLGYDMHRLVYSAKHVPDPRHTVAVELEKCKTYRWTVRPSYRVGSDTRFGEWMRFKTDTVTDNGNVGRKASEAPAYIQDFASLNIKC